MLVAHRGFRSPKGENRMVDFIQALKICKAVEFDIRLTKDKRIIIFHDHHLRRIGHENTTIRKITYQDLCNLEFFQKNKDYLPPLFIEDFIAKISDQYKMINVEVKPDRYSVQEFKQLKTALDILRSTTKAEIVVSSFSVNVLKWITTLDAKNFKKGYLFEKPSEINWDLIKKFDYVHPYVGTVLQKRNQVLFAKINLPMNIWTFKENITVDKVKKLYDSKMIHAYISDNPNLKIEDKESKSWN
ncbi:glycerophosphoryl diester phosphodiesterase [Williamsoniiplasma luminosum]|uniref:Glycerophosphoryl diester phosphodiesterase n=1 Tax=Williamsoniiplasma luminosum TaxID=214888 RepID=A0A2K8NU66_9MOLU|nr:glycerophosphodiester phosphodiesterase family protein [Williamsoniiplasma luminosum]ATZ17395.1 glycerophosphoryl diester phosphodiesterase [Williamsoniiplasma luminosum]